MYHDRGCAVIPGNLGEAVINMWNTEAFSIPESMCEARTYTLYGDIGAMQLIPTGDGAARLGPIAKLPRGAYLEVCGPGFNDRTLKVRSGGCYYFVFLEDIERKANGALAVGA